MTYDGHDAYIFYTAEATYGAPANDQTYDRLLEVSSVSGRGGSQEVKDMRRHGKRSRAGFPRGKRDESNLVFEVTLTDDDQTTNVYDVFLKTIFDDTFDASPTSYVFVISDNTNPAVSTNLEYYYGCILDEVEITIEEGEPITATLSFIRQTFVPSATELHVSVSNTYNAYPASITYLLWSDVTITKVAASGWTTTGAVTNYSSVTLSISQGGEKKFRINGTKIPKDVHFGAYTVSGSFTIDYDDLNEITELTSENSGDITLLLSPTAGAMGTITINEVTFEAVEFDSEPNSLITIDVDFSADTVTFAD